MKHVGIIGMLAVAVFFLIFPPQAGAHCEIPCGIYDDAARIALILEHVQTIEKSMYAIIELQEKQSINYNQLVRWVTNKEHHATEIQHIVTQYFMTQRIKFDTPQYEKKLALLHKALVLAMKCKQTTDLTHTATLRQTVESFSHLYFAKEK